MEPEIFGPLSGIKTMEMVRHIRLQGGYQAGILLQRMVLIGTPTVRQMNGRLMSKRASLNHSFEKADNSFLRIWQGRVDTGVRIRYLPGDQNGGVGNDGRSNWRNVCIFPPSVATINNPHPIAINDYQWGIVYTYEQTLSTLVGCMTMSYTVSGQLAME